MSDPLTTNDVVVGIITVVAGYGVWMLKKLVANIESLNEKMAVVMVTMAQKQKAIEDHEDRLRDIEPRVVLLERASLQ